MSFFKLLLEPSLDSIFRNKESGHLKSIFAFIVDNGPGEAPSSPMVKMLLVRLLKYLDLDIVAQLSFAEYHRKMNFVESVHATENECLSRHGPFCSKSIHREFRVGDEKHKENIEAMAAEVIACIQQGKYSEHPISCFRGIVIGIMRFAMSNSTENLNLHGIHVHLRESKLKKLFFLNAVH